MNRLPRWLRRMTPAELTSPEPSRADDIMQIAALKVQVAQKDKEIAHLKTRLELADALINRERNKAK